ncbi:hypothetical protein L198_07937 [Cryptococcus wingfieldii CBS 7118]|uniref:peptidylprolyl isomerase n=1 Tax=Cryptococcus wingfieldii CBS 7118 TaxID=1295528 RepID=A0A1E3HRR3_9TREE|nr:hypothetical protein L198_07937 [Cryptococcus wingfieldii CBS 7118]ODN79058.1 hypothetical protein L198_07937 [Cryptococcus wingfieldii CBS 7118]
MAANPRVFFDLAVHDSKLGRVVFELFADVVPKTAENFRALCTGEKGISPISSLPLHYKSSIIHRVIPSFMIQGGDFTKRTGSGGESIYGGGTFEDERLEARADNGRSLLVMANRGPDTNKSQFFITLAPSPHLTGKHVVFGRVVFGMEHIDAIGNLPTDDRDRPLSPVTIIHCGELELRRPPAAAKPRSPSPTPSRSRSPEPKRRRYSDSEDAGSDDSREYRRKRKERKREKRERREKEGKKSSRRDREETEAELDERLEREEKEMLEKQRVEKLAETKRRLEEERQRIKDDGGIVYKGESSYRPSRGAMRFRDPETIAHRAPRNFNAPTYSHLPGRPRHQPNGPGPGFGPRVDRDRPPHRDTRLSRPDMGSLDKDMDRWQHDRSQHDRTAERSKFRRGEDEREKERSVSPVKEVPRAAAVENGQHSEDDMVLDLDD